MKNNAVKFLLVPALLPVSATLVPAALLFLPTSVAHAQTYRGGVAGTVLDATGAVVPNAKVTLLSPETGFTRTQQSTGAGAYAFQDLPIGQYTITVEAAGFTATKVDKISVRPGAVYSLDPKLGMGSDTQTVDVNAAALALDTESTANNSVVNEKAVQDIPLNGRDYTQLIKIVPGYNGAGSLNGTRTNQNNYQIDGADSNDIWQNNAAANQGGVNGIAGVTIPIEAIDQFTVQSNANAEAGRNSGGLISLAIKTGTNRLHGSAYYYTRNEFFSARSPFLTPGTRKPKLRNQQFGASLGGPIIKDKLFFFVNYERQKFVIQSTSPATEPVAAYVTAATNLLNAHGQTVNPLSLRVLSLWPLGGATGYAASIGNYLEQTPQVGYSDNSIGNLNYQLTSRQSLKLQAFVGTGRQIAPVGSYVYPYYEVAPDIAQNFSLSHNWAVTDRISNQALAAVGIFNQTFNDVVHNQNIPALGLNTGVTNPNLFGAPTINITSFDQTGATQPVGRKDYTGHVTDVMTLVAGKHQFRMGGEFRRNYMDLQYQRNVRGTFTFDGTATTPANLYNPITNPNGLRLAAGATSYINDSTFGAGDVRALADFLGGYVVSSSFVQGVLRRDIYEKTFAVFAQDQYQITPKLTLNYGLRYEYNGPLSSSGTLSDFRPGAAGADGFGLVLVGNNGRPALFNASKLNLSPRVGLAATLNSHVVVRGNYGLYYDAPNFNGFFDNRPGNGGAVGVQANYTGPTPVRTVSPALYQWQTGVNPFDGSSGAPAVYGLATVNQNFNTARSHNFGLNTEVQLSRNTIFTVAYVGAIGQRLFNLSDINQARPGTSTSTPSTQARRPYYTNTAIANRTIIGAINEVQSNGYSNYHSIQSTIRTSNYHGLTAQASYTFGHALDVISNTRGVAPQDSANLAAEYSNADFDVRHTFNGYVVYEAPQIGHRLPLLTKGWQGNMFLTLFTGTPFTIKAGSNRSGTAEGQDRVNYVTGAKYKGSNQVIVPASGSPYAQVLLPAASSPFSLPALGTFGNSSRNGFRGPGFGTVDASLVKNTQLHEGVNLQLRAEMFNLFNRINLANPTSSSFSFRQLRP